MYTIILNLRTFISSYCLVMLDTSKYLLLTNHCYHAKISILKSLNFSLQHKDFSEHITVKSVITMLFGIKGLRAVN